MTLFLRCCYIAAIVLMIVFASLQYVEAVLGSMIAAMLFGAAELWFDREGRANDREWSDTHPRL